MILTLNEKKVIRFLAASVRDHSINEIAKECDLAPNGAHKILKKLEKEGIIKFKKIANISSHTLNFNNEKTALILELSFIPEELEGRIRHRAEDLQPLKEVTSICIMFGSYITNKKSPGDLDLLFVLEKEQFNNYKKTLNKIQDIIPIKIQDVVQTSDDLKQNIKKEDPIILASIKEGIILWGFKELVNIIKNVNQE
ncbi:winged helix-turn-helix transcriptional regulator [Candidatus Woesearchaeota archaeon]|nr:winged helix-turn-helix transcriptional regulator [Candidatus Woesearchaeota archaeon]